MREHVLPTALLVAAIVCGGVSWALEGTALWVMLGLTLVLIIAGIVVAGRTGKRPRE